MTEDQLRQHVKSVARRYVATGADHEEFKGRMEQVKAIIHKRGVKSLAYVGSSELPQILVEISSLGEEAEGQAVS